MSKRAGFKRGSKTQKKKFNRGSKRGPSTKNLSKRIKHIENDLIELKWFDYPFAATITNAGVNLEGQWLITQGTAYNNRVGNKISPTSMQLRLSVVSDATQIVPVLVRMVAFWDRQANGGSPVLLNYNNGLLDPTTITNPCYAPRNYNTIDRYTIVEDKVMVINPVNWFVNTDVAGTSTVSETMPVAKFIRKTYKLGRTVKYDTNTGAIADLVSNVFYVALFTDTAVAAYQPLMSGAIRLYFKDA